MNSKRITTLLIVIFILAGGMYLPFVKSETFTAPISDQQTYYAYHSSYNQVELNYEDIFHIDSQFVTISQKKILGSFDKGQNSQRVIGELDSPWPMMSHDVYHTGRSPYNTTRPPEGIEIWRFDASDSFDGGVVIDKDRKLYFGGEDCHVYSVYPNGTLKWKTNLYRCMESTPAIDENGTIYIGTSLDSNCLFALYSNNGTVKWSYPTGNIIDSSPAIGTDGTIYFGDWNGYVNALHPDGRVKWKHHTGDIITGSPAIGPDGTVYIGSHDSSLYALNPNNGTVKWRFYTGGWVRVSPCVGDDGTVYCVSFDNYLYAIYPNNGTMKWRTFVNAGTNPTIGPDGTIYAGWDVLYAVNPDGSVKWTFPGYAYVEGGTPCTSKEGIIYFGTTGDKIVAINPNGTLRWVRDLTRPCQSPPAIDSNGCIYIGSESPGAAIHAFGLGPLHVEIYGPYEGSATVPIQFTGDIFGGVPPYTCHWDFGDNQTSTEQNPKHAYDHYGVYTATFTATDSQGNHSTDNATVGVHYPPPTARMTKPVNGSIYFMNVRILPFHGTLIIGPITVNVEASQEQFGINRVEFCIDNYLKATVKTPPYTYTWRTLSFFQHYLSAEVYDNSGNLTRVGYFVWKFF